MNLKYITLILFLLLVLGGCSSKDCGNDTSCFEESAKLCTRAKVSIFADDNNITAIVRGKTSDHCKVTFKVEELNSFIKSKYPTESMVAKGKTLNCLLEKNKNDNTTYGYELKNIRDDFDNSCSGPLKDIIKSNPDFNMISNLKILT
jgi:hypothetical protein